MTRRHAHAKRGSAAGVEWRRVGRVIVMSAVALAIAAVSTAVILPRGAMAFAAEPAPPNLVSVDWGKMESIKTTEEKPPGGEFQFAPEFGQVRIKDIEEDGRLVRGGVSLNGKLLVRLRAAGIDDSAVVAIPDYDENKEYIFKVCLADGDQGDAEGCQSSDSTKWPDPDRGENPCSGGTRASRDNCRKGRKIFGFEGKDKEYNKWKAQIRGPELGPLGLRPPRGSKRSPSIDDRPDLDLSRGHAKGAADVAKPAGVMLRWLLWTSLGGCVVGFLLVGGNMAIKHKRGEVGAHAVGFGWVMVATVTAGSGAAVAFISLLIKPF